METLNQIYSPYLRERILYFKKGFTYSLIIETGGTSHPFLFISNPCETELFYGTYNIFQ